jgi:hypothetical protein
MSNSSRRLAGILLIVLPTVAFGGTSLLTMLLDPNSGYMTNPLRQNLWRAGHAHAGIMLVISLVILRYVDEANLSERLRLIVRHGAPAAAILMPLGFFCSILSPSATKPNALIYLVYVSFVILGVTFVLLGVGLLKAKKQV